MYQVLFSFICLTILVIYNAFVVYPYYTEAPKPCLVPDWHFSKSKQKYTFGGFTADMGWVLMVSRYAFSTGKEVAFPDHWGHGDLNTTSWETMFKTPYESCTRKSYFDNKNDRVRQKVKFKSYYTEMIGLNPNEQAQRALGFKFIEKNNDIKTMRALFSRIFQLNDHARKQVNKYKLRIAEPYVSMHIRWGDKIGRGPGTNDPKESVFIPLEHYVSQIPPHIRTIYVGTDDMTSIKELRHLLSPSHKIVHLDHIPKGGFSISQYKPNITKTYRIWADMEMMSGGELFIGNFASNVARTVHLMKHTPSIDVMDIMLKRTPWETCCRNKYNNCFWFCYE